MVHGSDDKADLWLPDESLTASLGASLSGVMQPRLVIYLEGGLGAGKTALVRALLRERGYAGNVKSPTYTLVESYPLSPVNFHHFDFYRLDHPQEYLYAGLDEYFDGEGVCLVEWPDEASPYVPSPDLRIELTVAGEGRKACVSAQGSKGLECLKNLMSNLPAGMKLPRDAGS